MRIIPCVQVQTPADCSVKGLLFEILRKVDEILGTRYHFNATRVNATADMLIGSVSTVALNHIGLLVVDEIQNVVNSKNGPTVVGMLTQLINNAGISICMVGTPKSALFFGQEMMLARRSLGLSYKPLSNKEGNFTMIFTSNKNPALWREDFDEDATLLCALDRIFDDATVFKLRGESFRGKKLETVSLQTGKIMAIESMGEPAE